MSKLKTATVPDYHKVQAKITLNEAIDEEPVAWMCPHDPEIETAFSWHPGLCESSGCGHQRVPIYAAPQPVLNLADKSVQKRLATQWGYVKDWQSLTDEEIWTSGSWIGLSDEGVRKFAREIEAKLKERNT